jgi:hypothetical protein
MTARPNWAAFRQDALTKEVAMVVVLDSAGLREDRELGAVSARCAVIDAEPVVADEHRAIVTADAVDAHATDARVAKASRTGTRRRAMRRHADTDRQARPGARVTALDLR